MEILFSTKLVSHTSTVTNCFLENSDSDPDWDVDNDYGPRNGRRRPRPTRSEIPKISECRQIFDEFTKKQIPQSDEIKCCLIFENATDQNTFDPTDLFLNSLLGKASLLAASKLNSNKQKI